MKFGCKGTEISINPQKNMGWRIAGIRFLRIIHYESACVVHPVSFGYIGNMVCRPFFGVPVIALSRDFLYFCMTKTREYSHDKRMEDHKEV